MPIRHLSRRTWLATAVIVIGVAAILVALFSGSGTPDDDADTPRSAPTSVRTFDPRPTATPTARLRDPLDAAQGGQEGEGDVFSQGFGKIARHKVTVRVRSDGVLNIGIKFRDGKQSVARVVDKTFEMSRTFRARLPAALVGMQILTGSKASCEILIDGVKLDDGTVEGQYQVGVCYG